ncbi:MAG: response regulator [Epsilonproteobacteria bacterium]|nr:response regulator [Campylobacterota bacterium]
MKERVPTLVASQEIYKSSKDIILSQWLSYATPQKILKQHKIKKDDFQREYASGVFDYFMGVIAGEVDIGHCPVMQKLLAYLKNREISAEELFEICSHFRRSMVDFSYDAGLNSKELFDEISFIFDKNFGGILKFYTDTIFQKLIDARQEALKAGQAKEFFLSNMSHEIRTPLNAILGFVNILKNEDISQKHKKYLNIILNSGENLLSIINDILDFSKLRSGEFSIYPKIFSLHEEINHTIELFVASADMKNITINSNIDDNIPTQLYADALRIKQVLSNFLSNAIKFTPKNGLINVETSYKDSKLKISVLDNGIGIKKEDITNIFTAFAQAQYSEHKNSFNSGSGLGLSISHQLVEHMDGVVDVESIYGLGSKFSMQIPVKTIHEAKLIDKDIQTFRLKEHKAGTKFKGHILIAEDNEANQELIKILLKKYGLTFDLAPNGAEAFELYKLHSYDLILMDEQMPIMDGNEAVQKILAYEKQNGIHHTPISALTANVIKGVKERELENGFDSFLGKPIILKELERVFSLYLKAYKNTTQNTIKKEFKNTIVGLNADKLKEELMLNEDELIMLLTLFIKKMKKQIPDLQNAIQLKDYKQITLNAHSIKGSSGNFRLESLQKHASEMESMAKAQEKDYNYKEKFLKIKNMVEEIKIL